MKFLKIKDIVMKEDKRDSNILEKDNSNKPIKYKQSKCTCRFVLEDEDNNEYVWVAENKSLADAIKKIGLNEEEKYGSFEEKSWLLGRNMFFLSWLYEFYEYYLTRFGFRPPKEHLEKASGHHPNQKPEQLMEEIIKIMTNKGFIVLDPFLGSGTTAIACLKQGRKFIGIEKEEEYFNIAKTRIKPYLQQEVLDF